MTALATVYYGSALYHLSLWRRAPIGLAIALAKPWPGDATRGQALIGGEFRLAGETLREPSPPWDSQDLRSAFAAELHRFSWLADLMATDGRSVAVDWTQRWLDHCDAWMPLAWRAEVVADRLVTWTEHFDALARGDDFRTRLMTSYARQAGHLARTAVGEVAGLPRLGALRGLVVSALALGRRRRARHSLAGFLREVDSQIRSDGGHVERGPRAQAQALRYLIDARDALRAAELEVPAPLQSAIDRAAPMLRFFRHGDGRFALFNGANEGESAAIELILARAEAKGKAPASAPYIGFQRLQAVKSVVLIDAGAPASSGFDRDAHAGTLAFEMSHGKDRVIVNCGAYHGPSAEWRALSRATAAHSTLAVADTNSAEIRAHGLGRHPRRVGCERAEDRGSQWIAARHDGYQAGFGLSHARQFFLAADGQDLRGEDKLTGRPGASFSIRFHLHPSVQASLIQDGAAALLRLPSGVGWRFRAAGAAMSLAESIYLGAETPRKSQQIVLDGQVGAEGATVKWALRREQKKTEKAEKSAESGNGK
jgi:uncharacterized heparinase superfamily protein